MINLDFYYNQLIEFVVKNSAELKIYMGCSLSALAPILSSKAAKTSARKLEEARKRLGVEKLTLWDAIRYGYISYAWAIIAELLGIGCILSGNHEHIKREAALFTFGTAAERMLVNYKKEILERFGPKKSEEVMRDVAVKEHERVRDIYPTYETGNGEYPFFDSRLLISFKSRTQAVKDAFINLNHDMMTETTNEVTVADLLYYLHLPVTELKDSYGRSMVDGYYGMGWRADNGMIKYRIIPRMDNETGIVTCYIEYELGCEPRPLR